MDDLDAEIQAKLREAELLRKKAEVAQAKADEAELEATILKKAAALRPASGEAATTRSTTATSVIGVEDAIPRRGGRQPGSISMKWRQVLGDMVSGGNKPFDINGLILVASGRKIELEEKAARERVRRYVEKRFLVELGNGQFQVTDEAIVRFNLFG